MNCLHCGERISLVEQFKVWLQAQIPARVYYKIEELKQDRDLERLKVLYAATAKLTAREHQVCQGRIAGASFEDIAREMNVTRERIRQIEAKALRKLERNK